MKRKLFAAVLVLALLVSGYTLYAYLSTRGLRVYLMGTQMGAVLAGSWQFTFLAAVVLWSPGVVALVRKAAGLRGRKMAPGQAEDATEILQQGGMEATERLEPRKGEADAAGNRGIRKRKKAAQALRETAAATEPDGGSNGPLAPTELLEPRRGSVEATEILEPDGDGELPLTPPGTAGTPSESEKGSDMSEIGAATELMEEPPVREPMPEEKGEAIPFPAGQVYQGEKITAAPPRPTAPRLCPHCGHPVTGRFCAKCGAKVGE